MPNPVVAAVGADVQALSVVIANGATGALSDGYSLANGKPAGVQVPHAIDSATSMTFQVSYDGGKTYANFYADGSEYTVTVGIDQAVRLNYADFLGVTHFKVRLGTSGSPASITADRTLIFALVP